MAYEYLSIAVTVPVRTAVKIGDPFRIQGWNVKMFVIIYTNPANKLHSTSGRNNLSVPEGMTCNSSRRAWIEKCISNVRDRL